MQLSTGAGLAEGRRALQRPRPCSGRPSMSEYDAGLEKPTDDDRAQFIDAGDDADILDASEADIVDLAEVYGDDDWTRHTEPPEQGGNAYWRCEGCQREILASIGRDQLTHTDRCPVCMGDA